MQITIKQIMEKKNVSQAAAQGIMTYLRETKQATVCGQVDKAEGTKGKKANIFEVEDNIANSLQLT